jgi:hypothetical protein
MISHEEQQKLTLKIQENAKKFVEDFNEDDQLNFSEESLVYADQFIADQYQFGDPLNTEYNEEVLELVSAYILEVARKVIGGLYVHDGDRSTPILVYGQPNFEISFLVHDKVKDRMETKDAKGIAYYFKLFSEKSKKAKSG